MRKIIVSKSDLKEAYYEMTASVASAHFGVCLQTFYNMLDEAGIERKRPGFKRGENIKYEVID